MSEPQYELMTIRVNKKHRDYILNTLHLLEDIDDNHNCFLSVIGKLQLGKPDPVGIVLDTPGLSGESRVECILEIAHRAARAIRSLVKNFLETTQDQAFVNEAMEAYDTSVRNDPDYFAQGSSIRDARDILENQKKGLQS